VRATAPAACLFCFSACLLFADGPIAPYTPMTTKDRWLRYRYDTVTSPGVYFGSIFAAGSMQLRNEPSEWGQGSGGYARRTVSNFGQFAIEATIKSPLAAGLRYDTRYLRCGCKGAWRRIGYAIQMSVLTYDQHGHKRFDLPRFAGIYGSSMLSTYWYPDRYDPLVEGVRGGHAVVGFETGLNILSEFRPELNRFLPKKFRHE
jgi:hypothetical protein